MGNPCLWRSHGRVIKKEPGRDSQRSRRILDGVLLKPGKQDFKESCIEKTSKIRTNSAHWI